MIRKNSLNVLALYGSYVVMAVVVLVAMPQTIQAQVPPQTQNITGYLDGLHPTLSPRLYGWTADRNNQQKQLPVELWYGPTEKFSDAKLADTVSASLDSGDLLKATGIAGSHRFVWSIPPTFAGTNHYWFAYALKDDNKKVPLLKSPMKIALPAKAFQSTFIQPTANTVASIGNPFQVTWNVLAGTPGTMLIGFTGSGDTLFPEVAVRYLDGTATINLRGCSPLATSETPNCRAIRSRISSGLPFVVEGTYTPPNGSLTKIKSVAFKAAYPAGAKANCFVNGTYIKSGESKEFYSATSTTNPSCQTLAQVRSCSNGVMTGGDATYKYAACTAVVPKASCSLDGVTLADSQKRTFYSSITPTTAGRCTFNAQERSCADGVLSGSAAYNKASCTETILDYNKTWAPTKQPKMFGVFKDTSFAPDTGMILRYYIGTNNRVIAEYNKVQSSVQRSAFQSSKAVIGNWLGNPSLVSAQTKVTTGANSIGLSVAGPTGNPALSITANGEVTTLRARSHEQMISEFGSLFFPSKNDIPVLGGGGRPAKSYLLATPQFVEPVKLNDFSAIKFNVDATLKNVNIKTDCVTGTSTNARAQNCYNPKIHATQFRVAFGNVQWTDPRCKVPNPADPICQYHGKYLYFTLGLFDERNEYSSGFLIDNPTASWIYRINLRDFISGKPAQNPFKIKDKRSVAQGDILAIMKKQVLAAEKLGYLPPRLEVNGVVETDIQYLDHYAFSSTNVGYENTGISDITFDIHSLKLLGTRSGLPQSPSCEITISPDSITAGQSVTLSWKTALATSFSVNTSVVRSTPATSGSVTIKPTETRGYEGTVLGINGDNKCRAVVQVK